LQPWHKKALVLGTGGAAKAVHYVLTKLNIEFIEVSRTPSTPRQVRYRDVGKKEIQDHLLIINTSPVGMYPHTEECPPLPYDALTKKHYLFDLVYNPSKTLFLQ